MSDDGKKKLIVFIIIALFAVSLIAFIIMLLFIRMPLPVMVFYTVIDIAFLAALFYFGKQRIDEINEGMDNDTDNY